MRHRLGRSRHGHQHISRYVRWYPRQRCGRSGSYEKELMNANHLALEALAEEAREMGADAIVGVDLDYESIGGNDKSMLMVTANGTAVKLG